MRKVVALAVLMLTIGATMAFAAKGEFVMGGTGGMALPTGDFGDLADPGFTGGVFGDYGVAENVTIGVSALYHGFAASDELVSALKTSTSGAIDDASFTLMQFTGHVRYWFPSSGAVMPFVTAGGGIYNVGAEVEGPGGSADESESKGGFYGGVGFDFKTGPMWRVGVEGSYHNVMTEDESSQVIGVAGRIAFTFAGQTN